MTLTRLQGLAIEAITQHGIAPLPLTLSQKWRKSAAQTYPRTGLLMCCYCGWVTFRGLTSLREKLRRRQRLIRQPERGYATERLTG